MPIGILRRLLSRRPTIARPLCAVALVGVDVDGSRGDIHAEDGACEDAVGGFGLVGGDFVAGLEDAGEGEVAVLADETAGVGAVCDDGGVAGRGVGGLLGIGDFEGGGFAAEPCLGGLLVWKVR